MPAGDGQNDRGDQHQQADQAFPLVYLVGALITIAALAAVPVARARALPVSTVNGLAVDAILLTAALVRLLAVR